MKRKLKLPNDADPGHEVYHRETVCAAHRVHLCHVCLGGPPPKFDVFAAVHADLRQRDQKGWKEHGVALDARFERDWIRESYEECLDMAVYLKAELMKRGRP